MPPLAPPPTSTASGGSSFSGMFRVSCFGNGSLYSLTHRLFRPAKSRNGATEFARRHSDTQTGTLCGPERKRQHGHADCPCAATTHGGAQSPRTTEARFRARSATSADSPYARAYGRVVAGSKTGRSAETAKEFLVEAAGGLLNCDRREKRVFQYYRPVADLRDRSYERAGMARKRSLAAGANHVRQRARDAQRVAAIGKPMRQSLRDPQPTLGHRKQHHSAIRGQSPAIESRSDRFRPTAGN